jgi:hypothetical protein
MHNTHKLSVVCVIRTPIIASLLRPLLLLSRPGHQSLSARVGKKNFNRTKVRKVGKFTDFTDQNVFPTPTSWLWCQSV